ncbi:unnamed protein product [Ambrosiozyma monospora]|uniref:Unnamed protein product n=1 Tax=Ambrosiozyma monospora TaxID=43982 RepID=A0A9W6YVJ0_AMBMO|nr:unnamed protein product [Ambrosiozyma monospora]
MKVWFDPCYHQALQENEGKFPVPRADNFHIDQLTRKEVLHQKDNVTPSRRISDARINVYTSSGEKKQDRALEKINMNQLMLSIFLTISDLFKESGTQLSVGEIQRSIFVLHPQAYKDLVSEGLKYQRKHNNRIKCNGFLLESKGLEAFHFVSESNHLKCFFDVLRKSIEDDPYLIIPIGLNGSFHEFEFVFLDFRSREMSIFDVSQKFKVDFNDSYKVSEFLDKTKNTTSFNSPLYNAHLYVYRFCLWLVRCVELSIDSPNDIMLSLKLHDMTHLTGFYELVGGTKKTNNNSNPTVPENLMYAYNPKRFYQTLFNLKQLMIEITSRRTCDGEGCNFENISNAVLKKCNNVSVAHLAVMKDMIIKLIKDSKIDKSIPRGIYFYRDTSVVKPKVPSVHHEYVPYSLDVESLLNAIGPRKRSRKNPILDNVKEEFFNETVDKL